MATAAPPPGPDATITAVLGPTNTGKTHYAIERMLARPDGIIGLPLRLLAREVYDKVVELRGPGAAALITGEEKIQPPRARYFICTVEAMPMDRGADFVAIDEVQMCADPERGHVFTDRVLRARGRYETLFLGSDAARARIQSLVPAARFVGRERFSNLAWAGSKKISRLKPRSAVVAFSIDQVYAIAELIRRQRGGAAVVMGALSPRTRNAQVALYQQGDVDYLVATDAIGMGLNLDVDHVAFAGLSKFDGHRHRRLEANELAQIAGRAGRYTRDGTFGVTGEAPPIEPELVEAIEGHRFKPITKLMWRNHDLDFGTVQRLIGSLEASPDSPDLARAREAEDMRALRAMADDAEVRPLATRPDRVRLLWEVCQIPDFRKVAGQDHAHLISRIYRFLLEPSGVIPSDWIAGQVRRIDRVEGDIDALAKRLAFVRTWTYVANRADWVEDAPDWQATTRAVEDRLSDALHAKLTQRFVDRRTSVLMRRLKQKERLVAEVNENGEVTVEGEYLGRLDGFRFTVDEKATPDEVRTLRSASLAALQAELARRADRLYLAPDTAIDATEQGGLLWDGHAVGRLVKGDDPLAPRVQAFVDDHADPAVVEKVERRLSHWVQRRVQTLFEPMLKMRDDEAVSGLARGVAFQLSEAMGVIPRRQIADDIKALAQEERALLRKHGVRFGQHTIFMPLLLKPAPTRMRVLLWGLAEGFEELPEPPPPGQVTIIAEIPRPKGYWDKAGYRLCGTRAVRIDMLERLADMIRPLDARAGFEATADMLSITGCTLDQLAEIMQGLGFAAEKIERPKPARKPARGGAAGPAEHDAPATAPAPAGPEAGGEGEGVAGADTSPEAPATPSETPTPATGDTDTPATPAEAQSAAQSEPAADAAQAAPVVTTPPDAPTEAGPETAPEAAPAAQADPAATDPAAATDTTDTAATTQAGSAGAATPDAGEAGAVEMETVYLFTLRPRRPAGQRRRPAQDQDQPREGEGQSQRRRGGDGRKDRGPRPDRAAGTGKPQDAPASARPGGETAAGADGQRKRGKPEGRVHEGPPGKGKRGGPPGNAGTPQRGAGPKHRPEKEVDPDSPFAILQKLKNR